MCHDKPYFLLVYLLGEIRCTYTVKIMEDFTKGNSRNQQIFNHYPAKSRGISSDT